MIGGVDGYKWNITDSYDNNLNQRNNVNNKDELGKKGAVDKSKTTECQTCKNRKYVDGSRGSMFPMRITKLPRKTAKWYLHPSESRHRSARNVAVLIFPVV